MKPYELTEDEALDAYDFICSEGDVMAVAIAAQQKLIKWLKDFYCIPRWCKMHPLAHFDSMGGCWGITDGKVQEQGEEYCKNCEYHENK